MLDKDLGALLGAVEGYRDRTKEIASTSALDTNEQILIDGFRQKGFSFPTNEGMRKITKHPETEKIDRDPVISIIARNIRETIHGVREGKQNGLYAGTNAFHHGHLAYLSRSESILSYDMNPLVPYGFAFVVGLIGSLTKPEDFRNQIVEFVINPNKVGDYFKDTPLENSGLLSSNLSDQQRSELLKPLFYGVMTTMNEFNPAIHGPNIKAPPVFCWDEQSYNYFRQLILRDKVAGIVGNVTSQGFIGKLAKSMEIFHAENINTLYFSSIFDPRFSGKEGRRKFISNLKDEGIGKGSQIIESFLNSGWIVYDLKE